MIDALRPCDVVTADGDFAVASVNHDTDPFRGLCGGGGNFGIVTNFTFELHPPGSTVLAGTVAWPMDDAQRVLPFLREFLAGAADEVGVTANLRLAPLRTTSTWSRRGFPSMSATPSGTSAGCVWSRNPRRVSSTSMRHAR